MIITQLNGGLGNQMFQYAAGLALAEQRRTALKLDVSWFREYAEFEAHNRYALSCFNLIEQFATAEEVERLRGAALTRTERWSVGLARALRFNRYAGHMTQRGTEHIAKQFTFYPEFFALPNDTHLAGYWQSERFFAPVANLLRLHFSFRYPPQPAVAAMAERICQAGPSAAVHFRRGDYQRNATFAQHIGVVDLAYYHRAVALLREAHPGITFFIFSDDIDTIEREFQPGGEHVFVRATQPWHAYDKIRLMSLCQHAVISNSTFAWWAAWLNPSPTKLIVAPDPWFASSVHDCSQVVPDGWRRIPAHGN